jgi:hypothetical protein
MASRLNSAVPEMILKIEQLLTHYEYLSSSSSSSSFSPSAPINVTTLEVVSRCCIVGLKSTKINQYQVVGGIDGGEGICIGGSSSIRSASIAGSGGKSS